MDSTPSEVTSAEKKMPSETPTLPAILDFKKQLDTVGIELIFVPIPTKATIYPDMISEHITTKVQINNSRNSITSCKKGE